MHRNDWLKLGLSPADPGLEIGPLDHAIVSRSLANIRYADHASREELISKYAAHPHVDAEAIPEIDYVIGESGLRAAVAGQRFAYAIASHVIEHVPDPIGWLGDLHDMLVDGGVLALAIPDRRRCFDAIRRPSTAGEMVEAALMGHAKPSPARIFDAMSNEVTLHGAISWNQDALIEDLKISRTPAHALQITQQAYRTGEYFDVHCWVFTPGSFCNVMRTLSAAELLRLALLDMRQTEGNEFLVRLQRNDALSLYERLASYPASGTRYASLPEGFDAISYGRLNPDVALAGVDPNDHYVEYGRGEGRRWR